LTVEQALRKVQLTVREDIEPGPLDRRRSFRVDGRTSKALTLVDHQMDALDELEVALARDLRFEHMKEKEIDEAAWDFAVAANRRRDQTHVAAFIEEHAEEPRTLICSFPVEGLTIHRELDLFGVTFTPAEVAEVPEHMFSPVQGPIGAVVSTDCEGTSATAMKERAREKVEHALRQLRAGLREHHMIPDEQLRFRLGTTYWFSGGGGGWSTRRDEIIDVGLDDKLVELATSTEIARLPAEGGTSTEKAARRALRWFDDALLATEPLKEVLFLFFALEAILGDTSDDLKGESLALRRAVLSHKLNQGFTHPGRIYGLYDKVRSKGVHGGEPLEVSKSEVSKFQWDVRRAINEFLEYAGTEGFTKRGKLLVALDSDPARGEIKAKFLA
jgi:hypothetical protein